MILDAFLLFTGGSTGVGNSDGATDSPTTGTQESSNVIDLGIVSGIPSYANGGGARDLGVGDDPSLKVLVQVTTAFTGGTNIQLSLSGAPDSGTGIPGTYTIMAYGPIVVEANLVVGAQLLNIDVPRPAPAEALPRFLRIDYINSGTHTGGAIEGTIVVDRNDQIVGAMGKISGYRAGINIIN